MPESIDIIRFRSNTGYFTLADLFRLNHSMRLGVGGLSTYSARLAFESAHFQDESEIRSRTWAMIVGDVAKILHVNGVVQQMTFPEAGGMIMNYTVSAPPAVVLDCPSVGLTLRGPVRSFVREAIRWNGKDPSYGNRQGSFGSVAGGA